MVSQEEIWPLFLHLLSVLFFPGKPSLSGLSTNGVIFLQKLCCRLILTLPKPQTFLCDISLKLKAEVCVLVSKDTYSSTPKVAMCCHSNIIHILRCIASISSETWLSWDLRKEFPASCNSCRGSGI